jgi:hypothetical protein
MSKMKLVVMAIALAGLASVSAGAAAASSETSQSPLNFDSKGRAPLYNTFSAGVGTFDDYFTFKVPSSTIGSSVANAVASFDGYTPTVSLAAFDLYAGSPGGTGTKLATGYFPVGSFLGVLNAKNLAYGDYFLRVVGTVSPSGGAYTGTLTLMTVPVPEPGEWALMLSGLGLIGYIVRRRSTRGA